jgi:D-3-phosphoglycerate dehydrogenase
MARPVVVFNCARNYEPGSLEQDMPRIVANCEVRLTEARDGADLARELADADVLVARRDYVGRATLDLANHIRGIVTPGVGVEKVDVAAATELGIVVANSPGNSVTVAESALLLMLALAKQMPMWVATARAGTEPTS